MSGSRGRSYMQLSTNQFIALAVAGKLTEFLETQFGNDLTAHKGILHLNRQALAGLQLSVFSCQ
jgi:hypothetical protein